jgi:large subunit ribosomal protein L5
MQKLKFFYYNTIVYKFLDSFNLKTKSGVPYIKKIVLNRGFDEASQNSKFWDISLNEFSIITGQKPYITRSKKSISNFKLKKDIPIGMALTLRGDHMYSFLERLINLVLPRIKDFKGLLSTSFDGNGNYSFGLNDPFVFPEIEVNKFNKRFGFNITIVTSCKDDSESLFLLREFGLPIR